MNKTEAVILFGASKGGEDFITINTEYEILAAADNDPARVGSAVGHVPIIAPHTIPTYSFDKIIITSQWVDSIRTQLIDTLGIDPAKIVIPPKQKIKANLPFQHEETARLARALLVTINRVMKQHGVVAYVDSGTLLGLVRDKNLIPWDDDIDFAVNVDQFETAKTAVLAFMETPLMRDRLEWAATITSMQDEDVTININFTDQQGSLIPFETSIQKRVNCDGKSELVSSAGIFFAPEEHFTGYDTIEVFGEVFHAPKRHEAFLEFMYGEWRSPRKETKITDYDNRRTFSGIDPRSIAIRKRELK